MTSSSTDFCSLCTDDDISSHAIKWCTECEVFLCTDCEKHHKRSKASKEHITLSTVDYRKLPKSIHQTSNRCNDHDKKYELYCSVHSCPCCIQCIADKHKKCQEMKPLADFLKDVKSSAAIPLLRNDLKELKECFEEAIKHLRYKINTINIHREKGIEYVRSIRKLLDDHFDKLERKIIDDLESKHSALKSDMEDLVKEIENRCKRVGQLEDELCTMTKYATEVQLYVGMQELEKTTSKESKYIENLKSKNRLDNKILEVNISSAVDSILQDDYLFGNITIKSTPHSGHASRVSLDKETAHREVSVSKDGTTFVNRRPSIGQTSLSFNPNRHKCYKGARGTHGFKKPGIYFYEVILSLKVVAPMQLNSIVLEIGIARKSAIDNNKYIDGQQYAYSMIVAHHQVCDAACVHVVRDRKVNLHIPLVKNQVDGECRLVFGFLLNTDVSTWEIYNMEEDVCICVVRDVNCHEPLFPVISGYNPSQVQVTATFGSGH
ncbi:nuclear factor 7, ovary-like [Mytilus trossulus]|uniref:nuclear factor 7, ovary-like n=1 Tax=Mytilus trossulus TaxID=6551 RepID=UPI0030047E99